MRPFLALLAVTLFACPQPPIPQCDRVQVTADGMTPFGGFGGGFAGGVPGGGGGTGGGTTTPIHLDGESISMRMVAPLSSCPSDDLRVSVEVLAPDSAQVDNQFTSVRSSNSVVDTTVTFTPNGPGLFVVRAVFEPSLGARTFTVNVISNHSPSRAVTVALPASVSCAKTPWPVTRDTIACERANDQISLISNDGGVTTFNGSALVAIDDVLWSETDTHVLERREWSVDAGLTITRSIPGWSQTQMRGLHTKQTALRVRANMNAGLVLPDGGVTEAFFSSTDYDSGLFFTDTDGQPHVAGSFTCGNCLNSIVAFDDSFAWQQFGRGNLLNGFRRPITMNTPFSTPNRMLQLDPRDTQMPAQEPLERWPLIVDPNDRNTISLLIRPRSGALDWTAWPRGKLVRVGPTFVVLADSATAGPFSIVPIER